MVTALILGILAIIVGLIVLIWPKIINYAVGIWFLIWGILELLIYFNIIAGI
jgi:hypothetical protein